MSEIIKKNIVFVTGTRADYGKLKTVIKACNEEPSFNVTIFATGMHMLSKYGETIEEIRKDFSDKVYPFINQGVEEHMEITLSNTINGLSRYLDEYKTDLVVVHGDRVEALAGAIVGGIKNILVAHLEGGESSGTIDESIRHAVSKFSHLHFVSNEIALERIVRLGENPKNIHVIGSPNVDTIQNGSLPPIKLVKQHYELDYQEYAVLIYHPVTSETSDLREKTEEVMQACVNSGLNYIVIKPNNDFGSDTIVSVFKNYEMCDCFRFLPSMRFEAYLTALKHSLFIIGNSSSGIYDAPLFGVPTINIGSRQNGRFTAESIVNIPDGYSNVLSAINIAKVKPRFDINEFYGSGNSSAQFLKVLKTKNIFRISTQKAFFD
mgnify:CR=1 FL=1